MASPFSNENSLYFGGFDPNSNTATNLAWIYKKDYPVNSVANFTQRENNFILYPNPAKHSLCIESEIRKDQTFVIVNLLGENIRSGTLNEQIETLDISSLPQNVYILRIGNESLKFIKTE